MDMKQAKVRRGTVAYLRDHQQVPFLNLAHFRDEKEIKTIPYYWRDKEGKMSHLWHMDSLPRNTKVTCYHRQRGMKYSMWTVTDPESEAIGKIFIVGFRFDDREEDEEEQTFRYTNVSPFIRHSLLSDKHLKPKKVQPAL